MYISDDQEISRGPRPSGHLEGRGNSQYRRECTTTQYIPTQGCEGHSLVINPSLGMYQAIHPYYRAMSIVCVKINISLLMMTEWAVCQLDCISLSNVLQLCGFSSECSPDLCTVKWILSSVLMFCGFSPVCS